jgi:hypothetical protein
MRYETATPKQPSAILATVDGSVPRFSCHAQKFMMEGLPLLRE